MRWSEVSSPVAAVAPEFPMVLVPAVGGGMPGICGAAGGGGGGLRRSGGGGMLADPEGRPSFPQKAFENPSGYWRPPRRGLYLISFLRGTHMMSLRAELVILSSSLKRGVCALSPK
jgi:hypothetical protein